MDRYMTDRDVWSIDPKVKCLWATRQERERLAAKALENAFSTEFKPFGDLSYLDEGLEVLFGGHDEKAIEIQDKWEGA